MVGIAHLVIEAQKLATAAIVESLEVVRAIVLAMSTVGKQEPLGTVTGSCNGWLHSGSTNRSHSCSSYCWSMCCVFALALHPKCRFVALTTYRLQSPTSRAFLLFLFSFPQTLPTHPLTHHPLSPTHAKLFQIFSHTHPKHQP